MLYAVVEPRFRRNFNAQRLCFIMLLFPEDVRGLISTLSILVIPLFVSLESNRLVLDALGLDIVPSGVLKPDLPS